MADFLTPFARVACLTIRKFKTNTLMLNPTYSTEQADSMTVDRLPNGLRDASTSKVSFNPDEYLEGLGTHVPNTRTGEKMPKGIYWKHGAYYAVKRNKWIRLGIDLGPSYEKMISMNSGEKEITPPKPRDVGYWMVDALNVMLFNSRARAKSIGREHELKIKDLKKLVEDTDYRCAVTGLRFTEWRNGKSKVRPFFPSLDRIDSNKGYVHGNCRIVCVAVNYAMSSWGEELFTTLAKAHIKHKADLDEKTRLAALSAEKTSTANQ